MPRKILSQSLSVSDAIQFWMLVVLFLSVIITSIFQLITNSLSRETTLLDRRPYLSIRFINPTHKATPNDTFIGGDILYSNYGKVPASEIKSAFFITTDLDKANHTLEGYAYEQWGGNKKVSYLAPGENDAISRRLSLSPSANFYYINIVISYKGLKNKCTYWISLTKAFRILDIENKKILLEIDSQANWDKDKNFSVPGLTEPDFSIYLKKNNIRNNEGEEKRMENTLELQEVLIKNIRCNYLLIVLLISILIRVIMSVFKAFAIKQGEADDKGEAIKFSDWTWGKCFKRAFRGFETHRNIDDYWMTVLLGSIELFSYPVLIKLGRWEFIGAWIGLKVASTWGPWQKTRTAYTRFLLGNLFVITSSIFLSTMIILS